MTRSRLTYLDELGREPRPLSQSPMRPMRGEEELPHVDGGGSSAGPPPSVFPRPLPDIARLVKPTQVDISVVSEASTATGLRHKHVEQAEYGNS